MIFNNVTVLGYDQATKFYGENSFAVSVVKTISIRGYVLDLTNFNGVKSILANTFTLQKECAKIQDIIINGNFFGSGRAKSFSVESGNWVRTTEYTATFEVYEDIDILQNLLSKEFNDIDLSITYLKSNFKFLTNFQEEFSINFDHNTKNLEGSHSIDIQYTSDGNNVKTLIDLAKALAIELLKTNSANIFESNYQYKTNYNKISSETYDLISKRCTFNVDFSYKADGDPSLISSDITHSISINQEGLITVTESYELIDNSESDLSGNLLLERVRLEIQNSYSRCLAFFNIHAPNIAGSLSYDSLLSKIFQKTIVINKLERRANFTVEYNNDSKRGENEKYILERTLEMQKNTEGVWSVKESGSSLGSGPLGSTEKYNNAKLGWNVVKPGVQGRIFSFYNQYSKKQGGSGPKYVNKSTDFAIYQGRVSYSVEYSDDPKITSEGGGSGPSFEVRVSDTGLRKLLKDYIIANNGYAIQQNTGLIQQGEQRITARLLSVGDGSEECLRKHSGNVAAESSFNGLDYFNILKQKAAFQPSEARDGHKDLYLDSIEFQVDEIEKTAEITQTFKYS
jgi:hypothetical protein